MSRLSPGMDTALAGVTPTIFGALEIVLPAQTIRVIDGSGVVSFDGKTFSGQDATYGVLKSVEDLNDGTGDQAPALEFTFLPASNAATASLASASMQGSQVTAWLGVVDPATGLVVGEPLVVFLGLLDVPKIRSAANSLEVSFECTSEFEDFFLSDDGARLNGDWQKSVWPGETGLDHMLIVTQIFYWGSDSVSGVTVQ